jgi:hypothetical protein
MVTQTPVYYQLFHGKDSSELCIPRTPELDVAFEQQDWNVFIQAEKDWFIEHVVNMPSVSKVPLSEIAEDDDYCGNVDADITDNIIRNSVDNTNYVECQCSICRKIKPSLYRVHPSDFGEENCAKEWICDACYGELLDDD